MRRIITSILFLPVILSVFAQKEKHIDDWLPVFESSFPTRFFMAKVDSKFDYRISSTSSIPEIGSGFTEVKQDRTATLSLKFPIANNHDFKLTGGLKYFDEEMAFEDEGYINYPLYVSLEDRNLKNLGGNLNGLFHLNGNRSIVARSSFALAGDFYRKGDSFSFSKILKISMAVGYGIKKDPNTYYAFGAYFGYTFGTPSVYPAMVWSKRFRRGFGIDAILPQSIRVWKMVNKNMFIYSKSNITGNSYTVRLINSILEEAESLQLRSSFITSSLGVTQKLGEWVWLEGEAGFATDLNFNLSETNFVKGSTLPRPNTDYLIKSKVKTAPYISIALFLAPPEGFMDRFRN